MADGATDAATLAPTRPRRRGSSTRAATAGATGDQRDAARPRLPRRRSRPLARHLLGRRADARVAGAGAGRRPRPAAARRADEPPRHRLAGVARDAPAARSTPRSCSSPTTAGSSRPSAPSVLELEAGRSRFFTGTWHAWRKEKAARELALGRAIEHQQAEIERLERFVTRFRAGDDARGRRSRASSGWTRWSASTRDPRDARGPDVRVQAARALRPGRASSCAGARAADRRPRAPATTPSCGSSAASTCRSSAPTARARRR